MRTKPLLALLGLLAAIPARGLEPYLVKDINLVPAPDSSNPGSFATFKGAAFFSADDGVSGFELWRSDGTEAGTRLVAETCEPDCSGNPRPFAVAPDLFFFLGNGDRRELWVTGGDALSTFRLTEATVWAAEPVWVASQRVLYFEARDQAHGDELWRSDGTAAGTYRVSDIRPGPSGSGPLFLAELGGKIYFGADDGRGEGLWRTDGTARGTVQVKAPLGISNLRVVGKNLIFTGFTPARGNELWRSDGTAKGTVMIADLSPGSASTEIRYLAVIGKRLFFFARTAKGGQHLWVTDGTAAGTRSLSQPAGATPAYNGSAVLGGRLVFRAIHPKSGLELWTTDGTAKGTRLLRDVCPGTCEGSADGLFSVNEGRLFFAGSAPGQGDEPWVTDGTAAGTRLLRDLCAGPCDSSPRGGRAIGRRTLFTSNIDSENYEIWATDATASGTSRIADLPIRHGQQPITSYYLGAFAGERLLFAALDALHGVELWRTDGTAAGTSIAKDINQVDLGGSDVRLVGAAGNRAFFYAEDGEHGYELWTSDGTETGTALIQELIPGEEPQSPPIYGQPADAAGDRLFFLRTLEGAPTLWTSDGTGTGTLQLSGPDRRVCCNSGLRVVDGKAFFLADGGVGDAGRGLWVSDGTVAGTRLVKELDALGSDFTAFQGKLYFLARLDGHRELWRSDGTEAGTGPFLPPGLVDASLPTVHGGRLWFLADDGEHGLELWSTDGTMVGTRLELDVVPGPDSVPIASLGFLGTKLFFSVAGYTDAGLWVSDFTAAGTRRLVPEVVDRIRIWTPFQGRLYFSALDEVTAPDELPFVLWASDGTEEGTAPLSDASGQRIFYPGSFEVMGDRLLFLAVANGTGALWETDGTAPGTVPILGRVSGLMVKAGDRVFFRAWDPAIGEELWAVEP